MKPVRILSYMEQGNQEVYPCAGIVARVVVSGDEVRLSLRLSADRAGVRMRLEVVVMV